MSEFDSWPSGLERSDLTTKQECIIEAAVESNYNNSEDISERADSSKSYTITTLKENWPEYYHGCIEHGSEIGTGGNL